MADAAQATATPAAPVSQTPPPAAAPADLNAATAAIDAAKAAATPAKPETAAEPKADSKAEAPKPVELQPKKKSSGEVLDAMKREQQFRQQERKAKEALATLQKQEAEWKARMAAAGDPNADPVAYLEKLGVPFEKLVSTITSREPPKVEDQVKALEQKILDFQKQQAEAMERARREQEQADFEEFRRQAVAHVTRDTEKNELISAFNAQEYVPQLISEYAREYNKVLDVDEAAALVREDLEKVVEKIAATKWFQAKYQKAAPAAPPAKEVDSGEKKDAMTLTASATASAAAVEQAKQPLTAEQARAAAIEILEAHRRRKSP